MSDPDEAHAGEPREGGLPPASTTTGLATGDYIGDTVTTDVPTEDLAHAQRAEPPPSARRLDAEVTSDAGPVVITVEMP